METSNGALDALVNTIVVQTFSMPALKVEEIKGKGKNNLVFKVQLDNGPIILRMSNSEDAFELYTKEKWCAEAIKNTEVPTPAILTIGKHGQYAFSFQEFVDGVHGTDAPNELGKIWFTLGRYAHLIHQIPAPTLVINYKETLKRLFADNFFITRNIFSKQVSDKIQSRLEETQTWKFLPQLCHGNLHPNNVIVDPKGVIHLIDWETATGNMNPQAELAEMYTWNTGKDNIALFLEGYGLNKTDTEVAMRDIQTLVLLRLVDVIRRKIVKNPTDSWKQDAYIQETSERLTDIDNYQENILFTKNL
jgi:aminoglycoside phosphotransferase (APT) family kinase protein